MAKIAPDTLTGALPEDASAPSLSDGLSTAEVAANGERFGTNVFTPIPQPTLFELIRKSFDDLMIRILVVAAAVSMLVGIRDGDYVDGIAITVAVAVVVVVGTYNELRAQKDYSALDATASKVAFRVVRDGEIREIDASDLVVGDLLDVNVGDIIPADSLYAAGDDLSVNEAQITGEPETSKPVGEPLYTSSRILDGSGRAVVTAVGDESVFGKMRISMHATEVTTPLQIRLEAFARKIGIVGSAVAVLTFAALIASGLVRNEVEAGWTLEFFEFLLEATTIAVTIVVVTVPEGLPLAVTLCLAYTTRKMADDNALVRELASCETMGSADIVCSDKTGTLTYGHMEVSAFVAHDGRHEADGMGSLPSDALDLFVRAVSVNSTADLITEADGEVRIVGNATEGALLKVIHDMGRDYRTERYAHERLDRIEFNSKRKFMSTTVSVNGANETHIKGAPERVLQQCDRMVGPALLPLDDPRREAITADLLDLAGRGYRTLALAYGDRSGDADAPLALIGIVALADRMRPEVPEAVQRCERAGVRVIMITGDIAETAFEISRQAGLAEDVSQVLTGDDFRAMSDEEIARRLGTIRVLARALPEDKRRMASLLQEGGHVVAMTGDGVNDAPALVGADVGFGMGSGSQVAREASDIVIVDDDFSTIVRAIRWGRSVFENIRKFVQFQLTVNVVALAVAFTAAVLGFGTPLTAVQLLWVNLIMDSLAAIALTLSKPTDELFDQPPNGRIEPLTSRFMWLNIIGSSIYMIAVVWLILGTDMLTDEPSTGLVRTTLVFNVFVFLQIFNAFNARVVRPGRTPWHNLRGAPTFVGILIGIALVQVLIVEFGGSVFHTGGLTPSLWFWSLVIGATVIPLGTVFRWAAPRLFPFLAADARAARAPGQATV